MLVMTFARVLMVVGLVMTLASATSLTFGSSFLGPSAPPGDVIDAIDAIEARL